MTTPAASYPLVASEPVHLVDLIDYVLNHDTLSSTLVICSTQEAFVKRLQFRSGTQSHEAGERSTDYIQLEQLRSKADRWAIPVLRLLASSRRIRLAFCPDVAHLRAYLGAYDARTPIHENDFASHGLPLLVIVNPIALHRPTSAFSAQGLNRTFAVAVEAAARAGSRLLLAECVPDTGQELQTEDEEDFNGAADPEANPWDEEVSILNVTTKTFGAGERGWVGRTVKIRAIAERWCRFEMLATGDH